MLHLTTYNIGIEAFCTSQQHLVHIHNVGALKQYKNIKMNENTIAVGVPVHYSSRHASRGERGDEARDTRIKRREKEDREAKRKASRSRSPIQASAPGAHSSTGDHKSNRKANRRAVADDSNHHHHHQHHPHHHHRHHNNHSSHHSPNRGDEKAAYRHGRHDASAPAVPGARAEHSPPRKCDEKAGYRSSSALAPGARAETSSRRRDERSKMHGYVRELKAEDNRSRSRSNSTDEGDPMVAAMIVEDDNEEEKAKKKEEEQTRIHAMIAAETQRERQRMEAENQRFREEMELAEADRKKKKKKRNIIICLVIVLLIVGGGAGAFFALQGRSSSGAVKQSNDQEGEIDPSETPTECPSNEPSSAPTIAPTIFRKYEIPSDEECQRIAAGLPLDGEENMEVKSFDILIDVDLVDERDIEPLVPEVQTKIEKYLVPDLIGCPHETSDTWHLRHLAKSDQDLSWENIRYAIAKAAVSVSVTKGAACQETKSTTCSVLNASATITIRGDEKIFNLITILSTVFRAGENIRPDLRLQAPFEFVTVRFIESKDPTTEPSIAPTGITSGSPTLVPSTSPSTSPTFAPAIGPTNPLTTKAPSKTPTPLPTLAPTPTPPPTAAPQPGVTSSPTTLPSTSPTNVPSKSPSSSPSSLPSELPSSSPSTEPSPVPSPAPTSGPTSAPTSNPTTSAPTSIYLGCFQDDVNRVLDMMPGGEFDVEGCRQFCRNIGYPYSAIQVGYQCFCGNQYDSLGAATNCNTQCFNPADQFCGGPLANSVYLSGASLETSVPALDSNLNCGCRGDILNGAPRDLPHQAPYTYLTQVGCIRYCKSQGYDFAGLQYGMECYCGNAAGSYGMSLNCYFLDKDFDGVSDGCWDYGVGACYDDSNHCKCGGSDSNSLFRTSQAVSCPPEIPPTSTFLGCTRDQYNSIVRDLSVLGTASASVAECRNICKDIGFAYSAVQFGQECFCGNSYGLYGAVVISECNKACIVNPSETGCGNAGRNSVYWSGAPIIAAVPDLEENLYCGCTRDITTQRDLEVMAPYSNLGQKACIHYCRTKGYSTYQEDSAVFICFVS